MHEDRLHKESVYNLKLFTDNIKHAPLFVCFVVSWHQISKLAFCLRGTGCIGNRKSKRVLQTFYKTFYNAHTEKQRHLKIDF